MIKLISPYKNLGCLGLRVGKHYVDVYRRPHLGMYCHLHYVAKFWLSRYAFKWEGKTFIMIWFPRGYQRLKIIIRRYD